MWNQESASEKGGEVRRAFRGGPPPLGSASHHHFGRQALTAPLPLYHLAKPSEGLVKPGWRVWPTTCSYEV